MNTCASELKQYIAAIQGVPVFSREHLTHHKYNKGLFAQRLKRLFGDAKIILTIRRQPDWIASSYAWHVRSIDRPWRAAFPSSLESYLSAHWDSRHHSRFTCCDYAQIARTYAGLFGKKRVGVFLFEEMVDQPQAFFQKMFEFIGVEPPVANQGIATPIANPRMSSRQYAFWWWRAVCVPLGALYVSSNSPWFPSCDRLFSGGRPFSVQLSESWLRRISEHYGEGNRWLMDNYDLPLESHGYPMSR